jgi:hypothetical protein
LIRKIKMRNVISLYYRKMEAQTHVVLSPAVALSATTTKNLSSLKVLPAINALYSLNGLFQVAHRYINAPIS